jgi:hypothetical protein
MLKSKVVGRVGFSKKLSMGENGEDQSARRLGKNMSGNGPSYKFNSIVIALNENIQLVSTTSCWVCREKDFQSPCVSQSESIATVPDSSLSWIKAVQLSFDGCARYQ